jgi:hypothetical protein
MSHFQDEEHKQFFNATFFFALYVCLFASRHVKSCHVKSPHVMSCQVTSCHATSPHVMSHHVRLRHATPRHVTSCQSHATSRHVTSPSHPQPSTQYRLRQSPQLWRLANEPVHKVAADLHKRRFKLVVDSRIRQTMLKKHY